MNPVIKSNQVWSEAILLDVNTKPVIKRAIVIGMPEDIEPSLMVRKTSPNIPPQAMACMLIL